MGFWRSTWDLLPDFNTFFLGIFLAFLGFALLFIPGEFKKLEDRKKMRFAIAFILITIGLFLGIGGFLSNQSQKEKQEEMTKELKNQITTLINSTQIQATNDDINKLRKEIQIRFDRVASAIKGKPIATQSIEPPPTIPTIENTRIIQKTTLSDDPQFLYGLQVIVQSNVVLQPVAIALECDEEIGKIKFFIAGQAVYMNVYTGIKEANKNVAMIRFSFPPLTPESPMVVTLLSKTKIRVVKAYKLNP